MMNIPEGFSPHFRRSKFTDPWEPLFSKVEDRQVRIGVVLDEAHCNSRGLVHGAFLAALADNAMGLSIGHILTSKGFKPQGLVTSGLSIDYLGKARIGSWIQTEIDVIKTGKTLNVANCLIVDDNGAIARANATFHVML